MQKSLTASIILALLLTSGCASKIAADLKTQGDSHLASNNTALAIEAYKASLAKKETALVHAKLGHVLTTQNKCEQALFHLKKAKTEEACEFELQRTLDIARCSYTLELNEQSAEHFVKAIEINPEDFSVTIESAKLWPKLDNHKNFGKWLDKIKAVQPDKHYAWAILGNHFYRLKQYDNAKFCYKTALSIFPKDIAVLSRYGSLMGLLGEFKIAKSLFEKALKIDDNPSIRFGLAGVYFREGSYDKAITELEIILLADKQNTNAMALLAQTYFIKGNFDLAMQNAMNAIKILKHPNIGLFKIVAQVSITKENYSLVIDLFNKHLAEKDKDAEIYEYIGICFAKQGSHLTALNNFAHSIALSPKRASAHRELGNLYVSMSRLLPAINSFKEAVKLNQSDAKAWLHYGLANIAVGKRSYALAKTALLKTVVLDPTNSLALANLAMLSADAKNFEETFEYLEKAADFGFDDTAYLGLSVFDPIRRSQNFRNISRKVSDNLLK